MKKILLLILLSVTFLGYSQSRNDKAQREIETLEKLSKMVEKDRLSEFEAKKTVLNFYYDTKSEVRDKYKYLSEVGKQEMDKVQKLLWEHKVESLIKVYEEVGYRKFLSAQYKSLLKYNEAINELLYFALDNELEIQNNMDDFGMMRTEYYFENWMEKP